MSKAMEALEELLTETINGYGNEKVILNKWTRTRINKIKQALEQLPRIQQEIDQWHEVANDNPKNAMTCISNIEKILGSDR